MTSNKETTEAKYGKDYWSKIGKIGGKAKVPKGIAKLTPEQRKELSKKALEARWGKDGVG